MRRRSVLLLALVSTLSLTSTVFAAGSPAFRRTEDVVYGRKYGTALTLDVFTPTGKTNRAAVIMVISGGWFSAHEMINPEVIAAFLDRGYTVFAVVHGSNPKYTIPEVMEDMHRAVRFIRFHAKVYGISPDRIGIAGGSAGGHLSLMIATSGKPGDPKAQDPVDRESSRLQVAGCFFPPTDFLNYGEPGRDAFVALENELKPFKAPFDFVELEKESRRFVRIDDPKRRIEILREISPVTHVTVDDPPALIIHGDADKLVPFQQAQAFQTKMAAVGVPFRLVVKPGEGHGWKDWVGDMAIIADWFDIHLLKSAPATAPH